MRLSSLTCCCLLVLALVQVQPARANESVHLMDGRGRTTGSATVQGESVVIRDGRGRTLGTLPRSPQNRELRATDRRGRLVAPSDVLP